MKKIFLLLFVTSQLMSSNLDYKIVGSLGLGSVCLLAAGYFTYSAKEAGRKFDEDKEADIKKTELWTRKAGEIRIDGGFDSNKFETFFDEIKHSNYPIRNKKAKDYAEEKCKNKNENERLEAFDDFIRWAVKPSSFLANPKNRPSLLTFKTITPAILTLIFFGVGGLKYRNATS